MNSVMDTLRNDNINEMNAIAEMEAFRYRVRFGLH